ncbi:MAG: branched-chain amino acid ABC transporter permease [Acidimicrobiales bacterium]|nr:branched-chain amino acid ABC transporter permease [Acidimicrobiales bacterium]
MLVETLFAGLFLAAIYALAAFGLAIVYGVLHVLNFAHGALLTLSAYLVFELVSSGWSLWPAIAVVTVITAALGVVLELLLFRRVIDRPLSGLIISIGLIGIIDSIVVVEWGPDPRALPTMLEGSVTILGGIIAKDRVLVVAIAIVGLGLAQLAITRTPWGKLLRATAEDREAAALQGVPVLRVRTAAFVAGAGLAAVAGGIIGTTLPVEPALGDNLVLKAFIVIIVGGVGTTGGTLLGAGVGLAEALSIAYLPTSAAQLAPLAVLIVILLTRPQGIVGTLTERV